MPGKYGALRYSFLPILNLNRERMAKELFKECSNEPRVSLIHVSHSVRLLFMKEIQAEMQTNGESQGNQQKCENKQPTHKQGVPTNVHESGSPFYLSVGNTATVG